MAFTDMMFFVIFASLLFCGSAFRSTFPAIVRESIRTELTMGAFGVKKLGQSVIDTTIPSSEDVNEKTLFRRPEIGDGTDDRGVMLPEEEDSHSTLSNMSKAFQQKNLLMGLQSERMGEVEKLERIRLASAVDGILPASTAFAPDTITASSLKAGGLTDEWDF